MDPSVRSHIARVEHARDTNAGLWHECFLPSQRPPKPEEGRTKKGPSGEPEVEHGEVVRRHLEQVASGGVPEGYGRALAWREEALRALHGGVEGGVTRVFTATAAGRLVVGLGAQSVLETNLALLRAWGVPYLPGSALKGLASSAAHRRGGPAWRRAETDAPGGPDAQALFGDTTVQGLVTFHDAWWLPEGDRLPLELDVMTVHHADYYGGQGVAPLDWDSPNPVAFLTAHGSYLVALSGPPEWVEAACAWLEVGLREDGLGAKTRAGYGRMALAPRLSAAEKAGLALAAALEALPAQHKGASTAAQHVARMREALDKGADLAAVRAVARSLYARDEAFWRDWWKRAERTEADRAFAARVAMVPAASAAPPPPPVAPPAKAAEGAAWQAGEAWTAVVKNRPMVFVRVGARTLDRERRLLAIDDALADALGRATETAPVAVEVQVKGKDKLDAVRLQPA